MNRVINFVAEHTVRAWGLTIAVAGGIGLLVGGLSHDWEEQKRLTRLQIDAERRGIELMAQTLNGSQMGAIGLMALVNEDAKREARNELAPNRQETIRLLEEIGRRHDADGVYFVGQDGIIKSSWGVGKPLTGVDVRFRPYFQTALKGKDNVYAAIGTTTGRRNLYFATPMYGGNSTDTPVIGAVVMRMGVVRLDQQVAGAGDIALLLSPQKVTFAASRESWIGRMAGLATPERIKDIRQLKQFGTLFDNKDPEPLPFSAEPGITTLDGGRYAVAHARVNWNDPYGDWTLVVLEDLSRSVPVAASARVGAAAAAVVLLLGWLVLQSLRARYRQLLAAQQLEAQEKTQHAGTERKMRLTSASVRLQQARSMMELAQSFLYECHAMLDSLQGVLYVAETQGDATVLRRAGAYACASPLPQTIEMGDGMLGQCAVERRTFVLEAPEEGFVLLRSGLGEARPRATLMTPILLNEKLVGVAEIALLSVPGSEDVALFEELAALLAMNIEILRRSAHTEAMLESTVAAERASAAQAQFRQVLVDTIPYPLFYKGPDTRFLGVNRAYEKTFNVGREDLVGKRVLDLEYLPEADRLAYQAEDEATIAGCGTVRREMVIPFADGKMHDTLYFVSGFRNADGSPGGLVGTFIDISEQKKAARELDRLADMERFNRLAQGREQRILELKREVNAMAKAQGQPEPYNTELVESVGDHEVKPHPDYRADLTEDGSPIQLENLVDLQELQVLLSNFCEAVGIASAIIDLQGKILAAARWQRACTDFHRVEARSCARCIESDTELALQLQEGQEFTMYKCKNGMTDAAAPIIVEGRHLANVFIGQFHVSLPDVAFFRRQAQEFGYDESAYLEAVQAAPVVDEAKLPAILSFLSGFARMISTMSLAKRRADLAQQAMTAQADLLRRERVAALSLAEDAAQARLALEYMTGEARQ